ncbi:hypothetical protein NON00_13035 [Roseomonas sp. GC11]|uniref:hypothetical protein n=1 Tax=Roseomonas sp. GC11 TaxID=2950546 RepID=UPI00210CEE2A|nr:hypothetical protein [Roseomonas sp. GC11]MCQ4160852.1 hypothetical protein [Roseomonas sp. GC11]
MTAALAFLAVRWRILAGVAASTAVVGAVLWALHLSAARDDALQERDAAVREVEDLRAGHSRIVFALERAARDAEARAARSAPTRRRIADAPATADAPVDPALLDALRLRSARPTP